MDFQFYVEPVIWGRSGVDIGLIFSWVVFSQGFPLQMRHGDILYHVLSPILILKVEGPEVNGIKNGIVLPVKGHSNKTCSGLVPSFDVEFNGPVLKIGTFQP